MSQRIAPICMWCRRYRRGDGSEERPGRTCEAFPEEIPPKIWNGDTDHREPFPGDHGLQYVQGPTEPPDHWAPGGKLP
jgi:hypothetical protein